MKGHLLTNIFQQMFLNVPCMSGVIGNQLLPQPHLHNLPLPLYIHAELKVVVWCNVWGNNIHNTLPTITQGFHISIALRMCGASLYQKAWFHMPEYWCCGLALPTRGHHHLATNEIPLVLFLLPSKASFQLRIQGYFVQIFMTTLSGYQVQEVLQGHVKTRGLVIGTANVKEKQNSRKFATSAKE